MQTAPASPDPASEQRQRQFVAAVTAARSETREGVRCELMVAALSPLQAMDLARPLPSTKPAMDDAETCRAQLAISDARIDTLNRAAAAYRADTTPLTAAALGRAGREVGRLAYSRNLSDATRQALDEVQAANTRLRESDGRLKAFGDAAASDGSGGLDAQTRLADTAQALIGFDLPRLSAPQKLIYEAGLRLGAEFADSDRRITAAIQAGTPTGAGRAGSGPGRGGWRAAPARLATGDDHWPEGSARTGTSGGTGLPPSKCCVRSVPDWKTHLMPRRTSWRAKSSASSAPLACPKPRQRTYALARDAAGRVQASDDKAQAGRAALGSWRRTPSPQAGSRVIAAYQQITRYDQARFSAAQQDVFRQLEAAYNVVAGKSLGLSLSTRTRLPIFVFARDVRGGSPEQLVGPFVAVLTRSGYLIATSRADAALLIEITGSVELRGVISNTMGSLLTAVADIDLRAFWGTDSSEFYRETSSLNGQGGTDTQAVTASLRRAAEQLAERFNTYVETRRRQ